MANNQIITVQDIPVTISKTAVAISVLPILLLQSLIMCVQLML